MNIKNYIKPIKQDINLTYKNSDISKCNTIEYCDKINWLFFAHNWSLIGSNLVKNELKLRINIILFSGEINFIKICKKSDKNNYLLITTNDNYIYLINTYYIQDSWNFYNYTENDYLFENFENVFSDKILFLRLKIQDFDENDYGIWSVDYSLKDQSIYFSSNKKIINKIKFDKNFDYEILSPELLFHLHNIPSINLSKCENYLVSGSIDKSIKVFDNNNNLIDSMAFLSFVWHVRWFCYDYNFCKNLSDYYIIIGTKINVEILQLIENKLIKIKNIQLYTNNLIEYGHYYYYTFIYKNLICIPLSISKLLLIIEFKLDLKEKKVLFKENFIITPSFLLSISGCFNKNKNELFLFLENVFQKKIDTFLLKMDDNFDIFLN